MRRALGVCATDRDSRADPGFRPGKAGRTPRIHCNTRGSSQRRQGESWGPSADSYPWRRLLALLALALAGAGCGTPTYYEWGRYEDSVYAVTHSPDGFDLGAEIDALERQVQQTLDKQRPIPPGLHAHLGYLHSVAGNPAAARQHFEQEKALFPESARFMDHLLARLGAQA